MTHMRTWRAALALALCAAVVPAVAQKSKLNSGYALMTSAKYDEAIKSINAGLAGDEGKLKPADKAKAYVKLAEAYLMVGSSPIFAKQAEQFPDRDIKSFEALEKAAEADAAKQYAKEIPDFYANVGGNLYNNGFTQYKAEKYKESVDLLNKAETAFTRSNDPNKDANLFATYNLRTYSNLSAADTAASLADAEKVRSILNANTKPDQVDAHQANIRFVADLYRLYKKDINKAIEVLEDGRKRYPENAELRDALLQLYGNMPDKKQVVEKLEAEYKAGNPSEITILMLANLVEKEQPDRALQLYQEAIALNANRWESHFNVGVYYVNKAAQLNEQSQATKDPKKAKTLQDQALDELRKAAPNLEKAHELNPTQYDVLDSLVRVYLYLNDTAKEKAFRTKRDALKG